jgi:hypothetical protein
MKINHSFQINSLLKMICDRFHQITILLPNHTFHEEIEHSLIYIDLYGRCSRHNINKDENKSLI